MADERACSLCRWRGLVEAGGAHVRRGVQHADEVGVEARGRGPPQAHRRRAGRPRRSAAGRPAPPGRPSACPPRCAGSRAATAPRSGSSTRSAVRNASSMGPWVVEREDVGALGVGPGHPPVHDDQGLAVVGHDPDVGGGGVGHLGGPVDQRAGHLAGGGGRGRRLGQPGEQAAGDCVAARPVGQPGASGCGHTSRRRSTARPWSGGRAGVPSPTTPRSTRPSRPRRRRGGGPRGHRRSAHRGPSRPGARSGHGSGHGGGIGCGTGGVGPPAPGAASPPERRQPAQPCSAGAKHRGHLGFDHLRHVGHRAGRGQRAPQAGDALHERDVARDLALVAGRAAGQQGQGDRQPGGGGQDAERRQGRRLLAVVHRDQPLGGHRPRARWWCPRRGRGRSRRAPCGRRPCRPRP